MDITVEKMIQNFLSLRNKYLLQRETDKCVRTKKKRSRISRIPNLKGDIFSQSSQQTIR